MALSSMDFIRRQVSVSDVRQAPRSCGRFTWRDGVMMTLEGSSITAGIVFLFYSLPVSGCFFGVSVASCCVHLCWRRDASIADMSRLATQIEHNTTTMEGTIVKIHRTGERIQKDVEALSLERKGLESVSEELEKAEVQEEVQIQAMQRSTHSLVESSSHLNLKIATLENQVQQLKSIIKMLQEHFQQAHEENEKLNSGMGDFSKEMAWMSRLESGFKKILATVDRQLQPEIAELGSHVVAAHKSYDDIFSQLNEKNAELLKEIETIKKTVQDFERIDQSIAEKTKHLQQLEEETRQTMEQFQKVKEEFEAITQALERMRKQFAEQTREIQFLERSLHMERSGFERVGTRLSETAGRLERDESHLQEMLQSYSTMNKSLDQQIKDIEDL